MDPSERGERGWRVAPRASAAFAAHAAAGVLLDGRVERPSLRFAGSMNRWKPEFGEGTARRREVDE